MSKHKPRIICFIFARGGSKGLPGKNIRMLAGKPLIAHSISLALACPRIETVIVSTDDEAIAHEAKLAGAEVPFLRPSHLASDTAPEWKAWQHAIEWFEQQRGKFDVFLSLPATSPFRAMEDIESCLDAISADEDTDAVITVCDAQRSPYFNMVTLDDRGFAGLVIPPSGSISRRQDTPAIYDITTVAYAAKPQFVLRSSKLFDGKIRTVNVPASRALDIDTPFDFELAEAIAHIQSQQSTD